MDPTTNLLTRGVDKIYPSQEELEKVLRSGKKLRLYQGFDPTGTQFHIGHAVGLRKLRQWQELGHEVIFLIGDGTGQAGDPSGKTRARDKFLDNKELRKNAKDYVLQASKVVSFDGPNPVKVLYNGDWLNKLGLVEILNIANHFTFQQMLERDLYQERLKSGIDISLREFMYPLLQAYDSVVMDVDLELGGSDQTFNMLMGRKLMRTMKQKEKFVMTVPLLTDAKGTKIGKTEGNVIGLTDAPNDLYGKIMSLSDDTIVNCLTLLTDTSVIDIEEMEKKMVSGENPMKFKKLLAHNIVESLHNKNMADLAEIHFEKTVQNKNVAEEDIKNVSVSGKMTMSDFLKNTLGENISGNEIKRTVEQGGVEVDGKKVTNPLEILEFKTGVLVKFGKRIFLRVRQ